MLEFRDKTDAKINSVYKPAESEQFARRMVYDRYSHMKSSRYVNGVSLENLWNKWIAQYEAWRDEARANDWQSTIVPPFTTSLVEKALSEIVGQTIRPRIVARGKEDKPKARLMNYIFDYTWEIGHGDLELKDALKNILVLGNCVWQEDYYIDKRLVKIMTKFDPEKKIEEYEEKEIYDFNDVYGENVPLWDFFLDEHARTINRGRYKAKDAIRRYVMDYDMFMELFKDSVWDQFGATKYVKAGAKADYYQYFLSPEGMRDNEVEVLFYWGRQPDKLIIIANDVVIRNNPNPYNHKQLPFSSGRDISRIHGFWARGEPELLNSIQDELTTIRRMRLDRVHLDTFKTLIVSNREIFDDDERITHPDDYVSVDDPGSVKALEYADIQPSAYQEEAALKQDGREVTGIQDPAPSGTATEAAIQKESTMKTLQMKVWEFSRDLMDGIVRLRVPNIVQYYTAPNVEKIVGENIRQITTMGVGLEIGADGQLVEKTGENGESFFGVSPDMIDPKYGSYDYKITGEASFPLSKPLRQQKLMEFFASPVISAAIQTNYYDLGKVADLLTEEHEIDPVELQATQQPEAQSAIDPAVLMEMASRENETMLKGKELPGTPYATAEHTKIHLAFMSSQEFIKAVGQNEGVAKAFANHVLQEDQAQQLRGQGQPKVALGGQRQGPMNESQGIFEGEAKAMNPSKVMGPELVPNG